MSHRGNREIPVPYYLRIMNSCNQKCRFCGYVSSGDGPEIDREDILSRIREIRNSMVATITFTGGEPTINPNLKEYIYTAKQSGFDTIEVETNGMMFSYQGFAESLRDEGLTHARITMTGHDASESDRITQTPEGWELTCRGIVRALDVGLYVTVQIPIIRGTATALPGHVEFISKRFPGVRRVELQLLDSDSGPDSEVGLSELEAALKDSLETSRRTGLSLAFIAGRGPAPCIFDDPEALAPVFNFPPMYPEVFKGYSGIPACEQCFISGVCPGVHETYAGAVDGMEEEKISAALAGKILRSGPGGNRSPVADQRMRGEQNFCSMTEAVLEDGSKALNEVLIRINYNCNQRCLFCWLEPGYENVPHDMVMKKISDISGAEMKMVSITGGEPTLNPHLAEYIGLLKKSGAREVSLQTNAVLLDRIEKVLPLVDVGLDSAFVSMHSHIPEISDLITGAPGTFERTVDGIRNLVRSGTFVTISHVINSFNYRRMEGFVEFVSSNFRNVPIVFSFAAPIYGAVIYRGLIPRMSDAAGYVTRALDRCHELKVPFSGLAGRCGMPPCVLGGGARYFPDLTPVPEPDGSSDMIKTEACRGCSLYSYCFGIRSNYVDIFGAGELKRIGMEGFKPQLLSYVDPRDFFRREVKE